MNYGSILHVFTSPIRFFRARIAMPPAWALAMSPVAIHSAIAAAAAVVSVTKGHAALEPTIARLGGENAGDGSWVGIGVVIGVLAVFAFTFVLFALHSGTVVTLDILFAQSARSRRLVEFTAYAYLPQLLWGAASLAVLALWWTPAPLRVPSSLSDADIRRVIADYQANLASTPLQLALRMIGVSFGLWLVALQSAALRVVSGFSPLGAVASGVLMASILVIMPWLLLT
jgi:hypothetical protein